MAAKKTVTKGKSRSKKAAKKGAKPAPGAAAAPAAGGGVLVVNMIPRSLSGETNQDSEPSLSVNPAKPLEIIGTAFTPDPMGGANAPIYVSTDGGKTWRLNAIVPSKVGSSLGTGDISLAFASASNNLYGGILRDPSFNIETLRTTSFTSATPMTVLNSRPNNDQPFTHAVTNAGKDHVYVGNNDFQAGPKTATVDVWANAAVANPTFKSVRIEVRATAGQDGPQIRPVAHPSGTVYAAFYGWRAQTGSFPGNTLVVTTDVVVVRDDASGAGANPFQNLKDPGDNLPGRIVARGVQVPFNRNGTPANGQQRLGGTLSVAVDPRPHGPEGGEAVYLAWADQQRSTGFTLHVRRSTDRGVNWSPTDLLTVAHGTNAALAVNSAGIVGLLYQQFTGSGGNLRWETHFRSSANGGAAWSDLVLANTPANVPVKTFDPYLGDYDHLVAVGKDFYGIFSANNTPNLANFPHGVKYQRNANFNTQTLLALNNTTPVAVSIDPFFFKVPG